jgi:hypothetical protein
MLKSLYLIIKMFFKTKIQLLLEIAMLAKQLEIYQRTDPKLKIKRSAKDKQGSNCLDKTDGK